MTFDSLINALRNGCRIPPGRIDAVLDGCGKTHRDLLYAVYGPALPARSGDVCPVCGGRYHVYSTVRVGTRRTRYLRCRACGFRPAANKQVTTTVANAPSAIQ